MPVHKHLKILEYALSSLMRRKFKNAAIIAVYTFTVFVLASVLFITHALRAEVTLILEEAPDLIVQRVSGGRHDLIPIAAARQIRSIPGVSSVEPRWWGYYYDALTDANFTFLGVGQEPKDLQLLAGRLPAAPGECAVGSGVAALRRTSAGRELVLIDSSNTGLVFDVVGVFEAKSALLTNDLVLLGKEDLLAFFAYPRDRATDLSVTLHNEREVQTVAAKIKSSMPDARPITRSEIIRTYDSVLNWRSGMLLTIFASAVVAFAILAWDKATGISAEEKREIGILRAIGWDYGDILELRFWEGIAVSLTSFLFGSILAYLHVFSFGASIMAPVLKGWSVLFPEFELLPVIDPYQIFVLGFFTIVPYVASTIVPSWKVSITDPDSVMRG